MHPCTPTLPERLQSQLVERLVKIILHGQSLQRGHLDNLKKRINSAEIKLSQVQPAQDQTLFITHNIRPFSGPGDWKFEPCALHYDTVSNLSLALFRSSDDMAPRIA
jgi:hypothetical protein